MLTINADQALAQHPLSCYTQAAALLAHNTGEAVQLIYNGRDTFVQPEEDASILWNRWHGDGRR